MRASATKKGLWGDSWARTAAALLAVFTPASLMAMAGPAFAAVVAPTNVGNTGSSSQGYADRQIFASTGGIAYAHSTPGGRSPSWYGLPSGGTPTVLSGLPAGYSLAGVQGTLAVVSDFNGNVAWESLDGTGAGSGTAIPSGASTSWTATSNQVSTAPGGWVTVADASGTTNAHLLLVTTGGSVTDLGALPSADGYNLAAGPDGAVYQEYTATGPTAWTYVPYAAPNTAVTLASDTSADYCSLVLSSDAICTQNSSTAITAVLVPLSGSADTPLSLPVNSVFVTGTPSYAAWIASGTVSFEAWSGGTVESVTANVALPAADLASDGTSLFFSGSQTVASAGIAEVTPPSTTATTINTETVAPTEASGVALTPGRVAWTDDFPPTSALASSAGPLWDRTLTNSSGALSTGSSASLVVTDASAYSLNAPAQLSISGRRTLYINDARNLTVQDPAASTTESTLGAASGFPATVSGSRVLWFDAATGKWMLRDLNTGTDADLSATIANGDTASLWGDYIAFETSDGSLYRWDISNLTNSPLQVLAGSSNQSCYNPSGGPYVAGDYVAWTESCYDTATGAQSLVSGYRNVTAGSTAVSLNAYVVALSGSYVATVPTNQYPMQPETVTATQLGTTTTASPGSASGPVALDGSTITWVDSSGDVQAEALPYVSEVPRYLGNGVAPSALVLPGTWNGEWDASGALTSCDVTITQSSTTVATVPCDSTDMSLGEAVVSWSGQDSGGSPVAAGNYTWTLTAAGPDGTLAGPDGSSLSLTGTISVTTPLTITTASLPDAVQGTSYAQTLAASGGTGPYAFSLAQGSNALPTGLNLSSTGQITGTPTTAGSASVTFQATDASTPTQSVTKNLTITVNPPVSITTTSLPSATIGVAYDQTLAASGGNGPYVFSLASGSKQLPAGMNLSPAGEITGTPTTAGSTSVTFEVTDSSTPTAATGTKVLTIIVNASSPNPPTGVEATAEVNSANVNWTAPTSGPTPSSYVITSNPASSSVNTDTTSTTVSGLTPGVSYTFTVVSVASGEDSLPSNPSNAVVPTSVAAQNTQANTGSDPSATTSTSSPSGSVTITADATGTGTVSVSTYPSDPVAAFRTGSAYFDVSTTSVSNFTSLTFAVCGLQVGSEVSWWNPAVQAWLPVSDATPVDASGCSSVTIDSTTSPSLSDLSGTIFAASGATFGLQPCGFLGWDFRYWWCGLLPWWRNTNGSAGRAVAVNLSQPVRFPTSSFPLTARWADRRPHALEHRW